MARVTETVTKRGTGRKDWSDNIELSVVPMVRSHQGRLTWAGETTGTYGPGDYNTSALLIPVEWRGETVQVRSFRLNFDENILVETEVIWMNFDLALLGYPVSAYTLETYGRGYNYKGHNWMAPKGISWKIEEDDPVSDFYPNTYMKKCPGIVIYNRSNKTYELEVKLFSSGFTSALIK